MNASDVAALQVRLRQLLPSDGAVHAEYSCEVAINPKILVGFDWGSGAWYRIMNGSITARSSNGRVFTGPEAGPFTDIDPAENIGDDVLDPYLPALVLRDLTIHPESVVDWKATPDGGLEIKVFYPHGSRIYLRMPPPADFPGQLKDITSTLHVDAAGTIVKWTDDNGTDKTTHKPVYSSLSGAKAKLVDNVPFESRAIGVRFDDSALASQAFSEERLIALLRQAETGKTVVPPVVYDKKSGSFVPRESAKPVDTFSVQRNAIIGVGVVLLLVAIWYLRRRA